MSRRSQAELDRIESQTLGHYNVNAQRFWQGTKDHDVSQNIEAFLSACVDDRPLDILDFGCGPGRDLHQFKQLGHQPIGLDGSDEFCQLARDYSACTVWQQNFLNLKLPAQAFDGVFANASLFHVPKQELVSVLKDLNRCLKPQGVLFMSNPRGQEEGWNGQRFGNYMQFESAQQFLQQADFEVLQHYYRPPGKPRNQQPWLAIISRKI